MIKSSGKYWGQSSNFLRRFQTEQNDFLGRIITGDETWVYSWDPETKRQSAEWRDFDKPRPEKVRRKQGALKVMHMIFFDMNGVILRWPVPIGTTINAQYYKKVLQDKLRPAIRNKRLGLLESGILFHHDNAPVHTARAVTDVLAGYKWELLEHPRYSPDLAPYEMDIQPPPNERPEDGRKDMTLSEFCLDFSQRTTAHGLRYAVSPEVVRIRRLLWLAVFLTTLGYLVYQLVALLTTYYRYPFKTVNRVVPQLSIPYPVVTLCDLNQVDAVKVDNSAMAVAFRSIDGNISYSGAVKDIFSAVTATVNRAACTWLELQHDVESVTEISQIQPAPQIAESLKANLVFSRKKQAKRGRQRRYYLDSGQVSGSAPSHTNSVPLRWALWIEL
ncbi:hypothetical protein RRG08_058538 [Elysia crispata]|uniref:Transposase n=1 Tax=Elysia crispata TaxID=231223 RepID=A0AAE1DXM7_9GAST|nr:hypothetical protein RRG08_058538 [Elysia crispata]